MKMIRPLYCVAAGVLLLTGCNKESGPESRTPATFGKVSYPATVEAGLPVRVRVPVESEYGFLQISIFYTEGSTPDETKEADVQLLTGDLKTVVYEGVIPKTAQKAGQKVTFRVCARTAYHVVSYSEQCSYTVLEEGTTVRPDPVE